MEEGNGFKMHTNIDVGAEIIITNPSELMKRYCRNELEIPNPKYHRALEKGYSIRGKPRNIVLYSQFGNVLSIPFGASEELWIRGIIDSTIPLNVSFSPIRNRTYSKRIEMYPFQETAVNDAIRGKNGIIVAPCGSGKTEMGLELIRRISGKALWITHTSELLMQSKRRAERLFGEFGMGSITQGRINSGERITFATVQTLNNVDLQKLKNEWDVVIVDECHRVCGSPTNVTMFYKVLSNVCARYKFGLTATPTRSDGAIRAMHALLGPTLHEVVREDVKELVCPVRVHRIPFEMEFDLRSVVGTDGTLNYVKMITSVVENEKRNEFLRDMISELDGVTLVLSERVEHVKKLCDMCDGVILSSGRKCQTGKLMFATYSLLGEGFDMPEIINLVMATPIKNERLVTQISGRVQRRSAGKNRGELWDLRDTCSIFTRYGKERDNIYRRLGFE